MHTVKLDKGADFIGREALLRQREQGPVMGMCGLLAFHTSEVTESQSLVFRELWLRRITSKGP